MARMTANDDDIRHLADIEHESTIVGIQRITLKDGSVIEGVCRGASSGNNFKGGMGMTRPTSFYSERTVQAIDGSMHTIDVLDMKSMVNVWEERKQAYIDAGLIIIASF